MVKVHIVGGPGSGKTTLGQTIAAKLHIRHHILKSLHGINPYPTKLLYSFLKDTREYYLNKVTADMAATMRAYFEEHGNYVEPPDTSILLTRLATYRMDGPPGVPPTAAFTRQYLGKYKEKVFVVRNNADREHLLELLAKI